MKDALWIAITKAGVATSGITQPESSVNEIDSAMLVSGIIGLTVLTIVAIMYFVNKGGGDDIERERHSKFYKLFLDAIK